MPIKCTPESPVRILSIDAWADGHDGWNWNNWFHIDCAPEGLTAETLLPWLVEAGILREDAVDKVEVDDDQYNLVVCDPAQERMPLWAYAYGEVES